MELVMRMFKSHMAVDEQTRYFNQMGKAVIPFFHDRSYGTSVKAVILCGVCMLPESDPLRPMHPPEPPEYKKSKKDLYLEVRLDYPTVLNGTREEILTHAVRKLIESFAQVVTLNLKDFNMDAFALDLIDQCKAFIAKPTVH